MLSDLIYRLRALFRRGTVEAEMNDELRFHFEQQVNKYEKAGLSREEAQRRAQLAFGGVDRAKEECREARGVSFIETTIQDLRHGLRALRKSPGFSIVAVLTMGLGIGANTAIFSVLNAAMLRPLPYRDPGRLVYVWSAEKARGINQSTVSIPDLRDWRAQSHSFDGMAGYFSGTYNLSGGDEPQQVNGSTVSPDFFEVLGAAPELGGTFAAGGGPQASDHVAVVSHSLWAGSFGGDKRILGRTVSLDGGPFVVVGVMPAEFSAPFPDVQLWMPWPARAAATAGRGDRFLRVIARLRPGVSVARAQADMDIVARHLSGVYREDAGVTAYLVPALEQITGNARPALLVLLGAVGFVLLIACANVANLLLARSAGRAKEFAVRIALGAGRARLIRQLLTESLLLAFLGGALGLVLTAWGARGLRGIAAGQIPRAQDIGVDAGVLLFTLGLSVVTGLAFGLLPAFTSLKGQLNDSLKEAGRGMSTGAHGYRVRDLLAVCEIALALMLLVAAGLLVNTLRRLRALDPGFVPNHVLTCQIALPSTYKDPQIVAFFQQLLDRVRALPGVKAAGATMTLPLQHSGGGFWGGLNIEGRPAATRESIPIVSFVQVTPGYFGAMGITLLKGRAFIQADNSNESPKVAIVNATLARRFFSGSDAVGGRICMGEDCTKGPWLTVVGVVGDTALGSLTDPHFPQVFSPHAQGVEGGSANRMALTVRTDRDPLLLASAIRANVHQLDKDQSVADIRTLEHVVDESLSERRLNALLLGAFAAAAVLLASIGIYGVLSYSVAHRSHEIGIRRALGARRADVLKLVVKHGFVLALTGVLIGLGGALVLARFMSSLLYGIQPTDPATLAGVSLVPIIAALVACYVPARRAAAVDPIVALRYE